MISLRPATLDDALILFAWRNDPETRRQSRNQDEILWETHLRWLERATRPKPDELGTHLWIGYHGEWPIGTGRIDASLSSREVSLTIAPVYRGKGYARPLLRALIGTDVARPLTAEIRVQNRRSLITFLKCGFFPYQVIDGLVFLAYNDAEEILDRRTHG